ncbi:hypothetical protein [Anatilimnocola floriformis]|uniref:hypothetical protein n=1 Tax=Anatilimnocola floriformis TaxID=2948575 RepID=UPI0020C490A9|nr:hypothetical protein [Anatilimnocola floriformis]
MLRSITGLAFVVAALCAAPAFALDTGFAFGDSSCGPNGCGPHGVRLHSAHHDHIDSRYYAGAGGCRTCSNGDCQYRFYGQPDLFYNYYVPPTCGGVGAELYLSPRPVPAHVGHTYITYQPLMPHEFMYKHDRTYHRYYNGGQGLTRTHVHYGTSILPNWRW